MASLDRSLRKELENAVKKARQVAEAAARQAVEQLAVPHHEPWASMSVADRQLRNRLRAHGRQLGDARDEKKGGQAIDRLVGECAYEHWHRLLFARFLAENDLLIEPGSGMPLALDECRELARERGADWLILASGFAEKMLPQIFRAGDPVLEVTLPPEKRNELEKVLESLSREVFIADDSLGWVYQFWQAERKEVVAKSARKIGAEELPAVTQLFTEDYMVLFLLHNTLGAWWAARVLASDPENARTAKSEDAVRKLCSLPGVSWEYLRFQRAGGVWYPAAGAFEGWPDSAREIRLLDPCMGSGHFLVFALPILAAMRGAEEQTSQSTAVDAVLKDNIFGLELDPRCTQIAAFNLAFTAWRAGGYRPLPRLNLACSGLAVRGTEEEWLDLGLEDARLRAGMARLHRLFSEGPTLGSLINPRLLEDDLLAAPFSDLQPLLERAISGEERSERHIEAAIAARGLATAARILGGEYTLVTTNVPFLGRGKQELVLRDYCDRVHPNASSDLSACMLERAFSLCHRGGCAALVSPQSWLFQTSYSAFRRGLLSTERVRLLASLGPKAFQTPMWDFSTVLTVTSHDAPEVGHRFSALSVASCREAEAKAEALRESEVLGLEQDAQRHNPDSKIVIGEIGDERPLGLVAESFQGIKTGDDGRFRGFFWERPKLSPPWRFLQSTVSASVAYGGRESVVRFGEDGAELARCQGKGAWGRRGVAVSQMAALPVTIYDGDLFDSNVAPIVPRAADSLASLWAFCTSDEFHARVRQLDQKVAVANATFTQIAFDAERWRQVAGNGGLGAMAQGGCSDPSQWLFGGAPRTSDAPLQVAVARLLGYRWPRQTGSTFPAFKELRSDDLDVHADADGIVALSAVKGEAPAAERLHRLLASAFGAEWSPSRLAALLSDAGCPGASLDMWLRDAFFQQHCALFLQRPFVWHLWDGRRDGFHALVNYHQLAGPGGGGRRTLERLVYSYLGDWIDRQRADRKADVEGADARVASAEHLRMELEKILEGEPPYDIFVRWKPITEQPVGWEPDLDDGVCANIRPFVSARTLDSRGKTASILRVTPRVKWDKDRGKESERPKADYPWFWGWDGATEDFAGGPKFDGNRWNDLHYTRVAKQAARQRAKRGGKS